MALSTIEVLTQISKEYKLIFEGMNEVNGGAIHPSSPEQFIHSVTPPGGLRQYCSKSKKLTRWE